MRANWLLLSCLSFFLWSLPAESAQLRSWRFDTHRNRLEFQTDTGVQPKAQLVANPIRLVIDLPGVNYGKPLASQSGRDGIEMVRIGQFDPQTTRIVVEMEPGYTIDPNQVRFQSTTGNRWIVELPDPVRLSDLAATPRSTPTTSRSTSSNATRATSSSRQTSSRAAAPQKATEIREVKVNSDGVYIKTRGDYPELAGQRSADGRSFTLDLENTLIASQLQRRSFSADRHGIRRVQVTQVQTNPPQARITLEMGNNGPDFGVQKRGSQGILLVPQAVSASQANRETVAHLQAVNVDESRGQLVIQADTAVRAQGAWNRQSLAYEMSLFPAQLPREFRQPQFNPNGSLRSIQVRQVDAQRVVIALQPNSGIQLGRLSQLDSRTIALQLERTRPSLPSGSTSSPPVNPVPLPSQPLPPKGQVVVMIDPGHGGGDPGAIGIGGIQEKEIVLDMSREIASVLQKHGIYTVMTRQDDREVELEPRVQQAAQVNATIFVSIHANSISLDRPEINGLETYYYSSGLNLASTIHRNVLQYTDMRDRGVRRARFYVLRNTSMPAVLVETGFVTGSEDAARFRNSARRSQLAQAIARGILEYLQGR